jgi:hypothetical protein
MRRKDSVLIAFFCGTISIILIIIIVILSIPNSLIDKHSMITSDSDILSSMHTFRFLFMLIFILASTGFVVKLLKRY